MLDSPRMRRRLLRWSAAVVVLGLVVIGVAVLVARHRSAAVFVDRTYYRGGPTDVPTAVTDAPPDPNGEALPAVAIGWTVDGSLAVVTWGSSSCPILVHSLKLTGPQRIALRVGEYVRPGDNACTADLGPTTSVLAAPPGIDRFRPTTADITGDIKARLTVPAAPR